jgi:preprotein translocase subunit YajC
MINLNIILQATQGSNPIFNVVLFGGMIVVFYFFMIRPQQKKVKAQKLFNEGLKKGDKIITNGGLHGKVLQIDTTIVIIESEGTRLKIEKAAISSELSAPLNKVEEVKA